MTSTLTYVNLSLDNYLEIDVNVETILKIRLDGDISIARDEKKVEYTTGSGIRITVNMYECMFEIHNESMVFKVSYADFPELPEVMEMIIKKYMDTRL